MTAGNIATCNLHKFHFNYSKVKAILGDSKYHNPNLVNQITESLMHSRTSTPVAPGDDDDLAAGCTDPGKLAHKLLFVGHVLAALQRPDQVKLTVSKRLLQGIGHSEIDSAAKTLLLTQCLSSLGLHVHQC